MPIPELILQATCYAPTPLGSEFPRGLFGAVESGQEEAVRFFQAWKAQVALGKPWTVEMISNLDQTAIQVIKEVPADRLLVWQVKEGWEPLCQVLCH